MKHVWSILCQTSIRDQDTRRTSIINSLDSIGFIVDKEKLEAKKNIPTSLEIVSLWNNNKEKIQDFLVKIDLLGFNKEVLSSSEIPVLKPKENINDNEMRSVTTSVSINLLPITAAGLYYFKVSQKNKEDKKFNIVAELPLDVKIKYKEKNISSKTSR
jgi:hypothetical protein